MLHHAASCPTPPVAHATRAAPAWACRAADAQTGLLACKLPPHPPFTLPCCLPPPHRSSRSCWSRTSAPWTTSRPRPARWVGVVAGKEDAEGSRPLEGRRRGKALPSPPGRAPGCAAGLLALGNPARARCPPPPALCSTSRTTRRSTRTRATSSSTTRGASHTGTGTARAPLSTARPRTRAPSPTRQRPPTRQCMQTRPQQPTAAPLSSRWWRRPAEPPLRHQPGRVVWRWQPTPVENPRATAVLRVATQAPPPRRRPSCTCRRRCPTASVHCSLPRQSGHPARAAQPFGRPAGRLLRCGPAPLA